MVFIIILESKSRPRARKCGQKTMLVHMFFHVFLYEKPHFLMVYTVFTGGPAFSSFSFFNVFVKVFVGWLFSTPFGGYLVVLVFLVALRIASDLSIS